MAIALAGGVDNAFVGLKHLSFLSIKHLLGARGIQAGVVGLIMPLGHVDLGWNVAFLRGLLKPYHCCEEVFLSFCLVGDGFALIHQAKADLVFLLSVKQVAVTELANGLDDGDEVVSQVQVHLPTLAIGG